MADPIRLDLTRYEAELLLELLTAHAARPTAPSVAEQDAVHALKAELGARLSGRKAAARAAEPEVLCAGPVVGGEHTDPFRAVVVRGRDGRLWAGNQNAATGKLAEGTHPAGPFEVARRAALNLWAGKVAEHVDLYAHTVGNPPPAGGAG